MTKKKGTGHATRRKEKKMARILVVDDDPDFQMVCQSVLKAEGYQVMQAANGDAAWTMLQQEKPDLILLDVMMSTTLEGVDVCKQIRADPKLKDLPVVMVSSIGSTEYASEFPDDERIPIDAWISKPLQPAVLVKTVKRFVK
jgi:CheY-like chemotaxis protein